MKRIGLSSASALESKEARPLGGGMYASPRLTEEEIVSVKKALDKKVEEEVKAKYKIEVTFGVNHHVDGTPTYGLINFWENGAHFHGDGDVLVYICPGKNLKVNTCETVIPDKMNGFGFVACPTCHQVWKREQLIGEVFCRMPIQKWAEAMLYWFTRLGHDADLKVKYNYRDIRFAAQQEQERQMRGDLLSVVRSSESRKPRSYYLADILKDVAHGADLYLQFLRFMRM